MSSGNSHLVHEDYKDGGINLERHSCSQEDSTTNLCTSDNQEKKECYRYLRSGRCKFGDSCRFLHQSSDKPLLETRKATPRDSQLYSKKPGSEENQESVQDAVGESSSTDKTRRFGKPSYYKETPICRFFKRVHGCRFGSRCRFSHAETEGTEQRNDSAHEHDEFLEADSKNEGEENHENAPTESNQSNATQQVKNIKEENNFSDNKQQQFKPRRRLCRHYRRGYCGYGQNCRFWHPPDHLAVDTDDSKYDQNTGATGSLSTSESQYIDYNDVEAIKSQQRLRGPPVKKIVTRQTNFPLESLNDEKLLELRNTEIEQLLKRFPSAEKEEEKYSFIFTPSDPDWPYDVKNVSMAIFIPTAYPKKMFRMYVLEDDDLPEIVGRQIAKASLEWIQTRFERLKNSGKVELMFRPFLKWLDKNIEDLFTEGLKKYKMELMAYAAGLEFIPACRLKEQHESSSDSDKEEDNVDNTCGVNEEQNPDGEPEGLDGNELSNPNEYQDNPNRAKFELDIRREGTEVKLLNLQLGESLSSLVLTHIHVIIKCERCRNMGEITTPAGRSNLMNCPKCSNEQLVMFRSTLVHPHSSVAGYLDLEGCAAHDLILSSCTLQTCCLNCSKEAELQGLASGQMTDSWCRGCHRKIQLAVESVRLTVLQSTAAKLSASGAHKIHLRKLGDVRNPAIVPGKPLPNQGTCKHYKKSYRWLRFPCCGKAYPCDICHDMNEVDHEMKYANRMICGFCCKEQNYSMEKPCIACNSSLTHKSTSHWEGGKGCRDKTRMSRDDPKKYANSNKTISRKAQTQPTTGKKTTK